MGQGPSYLRAFRLGSDLSVDVVVATDGDGQVSAKDLLLIALSLKIGEGGHVISVRTGINEPFYRRLVSTIANFLVLAKTSRAFKDSNSPHRAFSIGYQNEYLEGFSGNETTPNMLGTTQILNKWKTVRAVPVRFRDRLGTNKLGTSLGKTRLTQLPSVRFLKFCLNATLELIRR